MKMLMIEMFVLELCKRYHVDQLWSYSDTFKSIIKSVYSNMCPYDTNVFGWCLRTTMYPQGSMLGTLVRGVTVELTNTFSTASYHSKGI
jgi:hypothetical protein